MSRLKRLLAAALVSALMLVMMAAPAFAEHAAPGDDFSGSLFGECRMTDATDPTVIITCISPSHRGG